MWKLFLDFVVLRTILRSVGWLVALIPVAFLFKFVGLPLLAILGIIGLPLLLILLFLGLPIIVVLVLASMMMAVLGAVVAIGVPLLKIVLPIVAIVWLVGWFWRRGGSSGGPLTGEVKGPEPDAPSP